MDTSQNSIQSEYDLDSYALDVNEVAQLLGVTRTRVSQLTTAGVLPAERKKVGIRNRLFYKRSDVVNYQHNFFNRQVNSATRQAHSSMPHSTATIPWEPIDRAGASSQSSDDYRHNQQTPPTFLSSMNEPDFKFNGKNLNSSFNLIRKQLELLTSSPMVSAQWHSKEAKVAESINEIFQALNQIDTQFLNSQTLQLDTIAEIASLKKSLHQLNQIVLSHRHKTELCSAQQTQSQRETGNSIRPSSSHSRLKSARYRSTVKKRYS